VPKPEFDVFLSHASADKLVVEELARILKRRGIEPWLDAWNLVPGEPWQEAVEKALECCAACAVLLGRDGTGPWQNEEMRAAIERQVVRPDGYLVIPVLLPNAERGERSRLPAFLVRRTWVEFHDSLDDERVLHRLISGIRRVAPGQAPGEAVAEGACPYRGLRYFGVEDSLFFQGREALTGWLLAKLRPSRFDHRFLAITGPSGSGKSSLARAGLLAALGNGEIPGSAEWPVAVCRPGAQPLENLALALTAALSPGSSAASLPGMIRELGADPRMLHLTTRFALGSSPDRRLVLLIDQFEEVFTLCADESQRAALIANLLHAARETDGQTAVVLTLRSDFYGRCAAYPELAAALSDRNDLVGPMTEEELRGAIEKPARTAGLELEGGLADLLIGEVEGQPGCLPLLQHALLQIWERREARRLTVAAYREIGGVAGALRQHAEQVFASFTGGEPEACKTILLRLVQVDETGNVTKRRLGFEELVPPSDPEPDRRAAEGVIARLTAERLLTAEAAGEDRHATVELAHEALLSSWKRLEDWIDAGREALRTRRRLDEAVHEWQESGREPSYLYAGARLAQAEEWAAASPGESNEEARKFLAASTAQASRRRRRTILLLASAAAVAVLVATTMGWLWNRSERQRRTNLASLMAEQAKRNLPLNPLISLLLATEALRGGRDLPTAREALLGALALSDAQPLGRPGIVTAAASADRLSMATASRDGTVRIWGFAPGAPKAPERALRVEGPVTGLALSSDRRWLLVRNGDADVRLHDLKQDLTKEDQGTLLPDENWRPGDPFSLDSRWLITQQWGKAVQRDLAGGSRPPAAPSFPSMPPQDSRRWLATGMDNGSVRLVDKTSPGRDPVELPGQGRPVKFLFFVHGDRWLVTQAGEEAPRLWDLSRYLQADNSPVAAVLRDGGFLVRNPVSGELAPRAGSWRGPVTALAFHPERRLLALGGEGAARLWDLRGGAPEVVSTDPNGQSVSALAFGSRPPSLAIGWNKGRVVIVTLDKDGFLAAPSRDSAITALAFSPDGKALAIADANGKVWIWSPDAKEIPLDSQDRAVQTLAFSSDGRRLAGGGSKGTVQLWSLDGSRLPIVWQGHAGPIAQVSFAEDGKELITTGATDTVRRWSLDTDALIRLACRKAGRNLTEDEWKAVVPPGERFREGMPCG